MRLYITAVFIFFTLFAELFAGVHFVSKTGSSSPPYSSWAAAADSIQKAVNICNSGDTVYVGNGVYKENVVLRKGISFFGSGIDSCIIDTRTIFTETGFYAVKFEDSCVVKNFNIIVANNQTGFGIAIRTNANFSKIESNKISSASQGIYCYEANLIIRNNVISDCNNGINLIAFNTNPRPLIEGNIINVPKMGTGVISQIGNEPTIRNNTIIMGGYNTDYGINIFADQSAYIYNNIVVGNGDSDGINGREKPSIIRNNLVIGNFLWGGIVHGNYPVANNIIMNSRTGFISSNNNTKLRYNNIWNVTSHYNGENPDTTNISKYPMFVNEDSPDFHLQMFSPMIDAGDPDIKDVDGSRSDIGPYGGPYGESYTYKDLAPRIPSNLTSYSEANGIITLKWNKNLETDFYSYKVYSDTIKGFKVNSTKLIASIKDTVYTGQLFQSDKKYYKITALDSQGNESAASEEVGVEITGIHQTKIISEEYKLFANYPNPFNPSTIISYRIKERSRVKLIVYDIKGELVEVLINNEEDAGYHEVVFNANKGMTANFASGIYIYRLDVTNKNNIPVFTDIKKMILLK